MKKYFKLLLLIFILYVLVSLTTYFSMYEYSGDISSSCFDCSYQRDVLLFSMYIVILLSALFFLLRRLLKNESAVVIVFIVLFILFILYNNYVIFVDRVSSWSSFTILAELMGIVSHSYIYLIFSSILLYLFFKKIMTKIQNQKCLCLFF